MRQMKCGSGAVADRHYELNGLTGPGLEMILGPLNSGNSNNTHTVENTYKGFSIVLNSNHKLLIVS